VSTTAHAFRIVAGAACVWLLAAATVRADDPATPAVQKPAGQAQDAVATQAAPGVVGKLTVTVGKSLTIDSPLAIKRLSTANGALVEAVAIGPKEVLINGKAPGDTTLIIWQENDTRLIYDLTVRISPSRLNAVREQLARDYPDADLNVTFDNDTAFVRGTVKDTVASDRIMAIAGTLGKAINLLRVEVPAVEPQILLKVRFANVDRSASTNLSANFALPGAFHQSTALGTGSSLLTALGAVGSPTLSSAVNIFALRNDINLLAAIEALEAKNQLQMLAEPNLLTISGKSAAFTAGGEFPYPMVQPGSGTTTITVAFKEYGVRLNFLPHITPQGTIHMLVSPEVSALDYTNAVTLQGFLIPGMTVRRVQTEVDLDAGQSFVIAGLLDKQTTDAFEKIPGIGSIPLLGKLFQSKRVTKNNSELLVLITPEIVRPIAAQQPTPELKWVVPFLPDNSGFPLRQPGLDKTGPVPVHPPSDTMPIEQFIEKMKQVQSISGAGAAPSTATPAQAPAAPAGAPTAPGGAGAPTAPGGGGTASGGGNGQ